MGKIYMAAVMMSLSLVGGSVNTAYADTCSELIAFGVERVDSVEKEEIREQVVALLNQAKRLCEGGNKAQGILVAQKAIELSEVK